VSSGKQYLVSEHDWKENHAFPLLTIMPISLANYGYWTSRVKDYGGLLGRIHSSASWKYCPFWGGVDWESPTPQAVCKSCHGLNLQALPRSYGL